MVTPVTRPCFVSTLSTINGRTQEHKTLCVTKRDDDDYREGTTSMTPLTMHFRIGFHAPSLLSVVTKLKHIWVKPMGGNILDWAREQWTRHLDHGDDIVNTRYDDEAAVLGALGLTVNATEPGSRSISHERIHERAKFRKFNVTADAFYTNEDDPYRMTVVISTSLQRDRGPFTKHEPTDVITAEFIKSPFCDLPEAWSFTKLSYRQDDGQTQSFYPNEIGEHTTNTVLNSIRELMEEGRVMAQERGEDRKAGSTILLGGAIGRIRDALQYRHEAKCLADAKRTATAGGPQGSDNRHRPAA